MLEKKKKNEKLKEAGSMDKLTKGEIPCCISL